jgi:hypothetical protein
MLLELWISFGCLSLYRVFHLQVCILVLLLLNYVSAAVKTLSGCNLAVLKHFRTAVPIRLVLPVLSRLLSVFGERKAEGINSINSTGRRFVVLVIHQTMVVASALRVLLARQEPTRFRVALEIQLFKRHCACRAKLFPKVTLGFSCRPTWSNIINFFYFLNHLLQHRYLIHILTALSCGHS